MFRDVIGILTFESKNFRVRVDGPYSGSPFQGPLSGVSSDRELTRTRGSASQLETHRKFVLKMSQMCSPWNLRPLVLVLTPGTTRIPGMNCVSHISHCKTMYIFSLHTCLSSSSVASPFVFVGDTHS